MMGTLPFAFTYRDRSGVEDAIALDSMRTLWVDRDRAGIVFVEPADEEAMFLHEVVIEGREGIDGMTEIMETLLQVRAFERLEPPLPEDDGGWLLLEFRHPNPHTVALAIRRS